MNYKVGDKIRILSFSTIQKTWRHTNNYYAPPDIKNSIIFNKDMKKWCGVYLTIFEIRKRGKEEWYRCTEDGHKWMWTQHMIEQDVNEKVFNTLKGVKV